MVKKLLVLCEGYPSKEKIYNQAFIHSRNKEYLKYGVEVDVLSFSANKRYVYEKINVIPEPECMDLSQYAAVISHAPNIRNHYRFVRKNKNRIDNLILFFHGHEILKVHDYYPDDYSWFNKTSKIKKMIRNFYDEIKIFLLKRLLKKDYVRSVFVSQWMLDEALKCMRLNLLPTDSSIIINNPINSAFSNAHYEFTLKDKLADVITIRPLDGKKYAVDKVVELAIANPRLSFHIYGKGVFFQNVKKPDNVEVFDAFIEQKNIPALLNKYRAAVMPTRLDAQGVMMCEMASYGMPIIVSNLPVCHEMLDGFDNVTFIDNSDFNKTIIDFYALKPLKDFSVTEKFSASKLSKEELDFVLKGV